MHPSWATFVGHDADHCTHSHAPCNAPPGNVINIETLLRSDKVFGGRGGRGLGGAGEKQTVRVAEARSRLEEFEVDKVLQSDMVMREAVRAAEQDGWVGGQQQRGLWAALVGLHVCEMLSHVSILALLRTSYAVKAFVQTLHSILSPFIP